MTQYQKFLHRILLGKSDANIPFSDLTHLLTQIGFDMRVNGSHHIFRKEETGEKINLQKDGSKAKPYQVRQVRNILLKSKLGESKDV